MILLFKPHRPGFVQSRVSRLLIPVARRLVLPVIARRDARGPQSAARTCCLRTTSTGRKKGVFFGYFLCTSKESDPRYSIAEALALTNAAINDKHHPHPNPLPPAGEGESQKRDISYAEMTNKPHASGTRISTSSPPPSALCAVIR